jgi:cell division ATPase FtsA
MELWQFRIYASVEIKSEALIFCVTKIVTGKMFIIFKRECLNADGWLNENDEIKDINSAAMTLKKCLREYATIYPELKIVKISLILPSSQLKLQEIYKEINLDVNGAKIQLQDVNQPIQQIKNAIKSAVNQVEFTTIDTKVMSYKLDGQNVNYGQIGLTHAKKLGLTAMVYQLPIKVFASHDQVIRLAGCSTMLVTLNINELYSLIKSQPQNSTSILITNWNANNLEVGYFENGVLKNFKLIKGGMNLVIQNFAKKLKLKVEHAQSYIFNLIDFNSPNNLENVIYQRWDNQQKILNQYHTWEIHQILIRELDELYQQALNVAQYADSQQESENYHFGLIQKMAGSEHLLQTIKQWTWEHVYHTFTFGLGFNVQYNAIVGVNKTLEKINHQHPGVVYTSVGSFNPQPTKKTGKTYPAYQPNPKILEKPLFMKHEGILVDYQPTTKLKKN